MQHHHRNPRLSRYNKPSKELFVDYINDLNSRRLSPTQLVFGIPIQLTPDGISKVSVKFATELGWSTEEEFLTYRRVELSNLLRDMPITIHVAEHETSDILKAIKEQWGILLEESLITLAPAPTSIAVIAPVTDLPGFTAEDGVDDPPFLPSEENRDYILTFKAEHLIFFGQIKVQTRPSIKLLGTTIDSLMDLRLYYYDGTFDKPPVDIYIPNGELLLSDEVVECGERRHYESWLYVVKESGDDAVENVVSSYLTRLLTQLTGDVWISDPTMRTDFNLSGLRVLYNGFVSKEHPVTNHAYNYVIALELSSLCSNLSGILKIGYRYSDSRTPGNLSYNQSSVLPIFPR